MRSKSHLCGAAVSVCLACTRTAAAVSRVAQLVCGLATIALFVLAAQPARAATILWRAELPAGTPLDEAAVVQRIATTQSQLSRAVRLETIVSAPASARAALERARSGDVEVTLVPLSLLAAESPEFAVFESLFLFQDLAAVDGYASSVEGRRLLQALAKKGLRGLAFLHGGMVQIVTRRQLQGPEQLRGLRVAVSGSAASAQQFSALGANPQRLPFAEISSALQQGAVDGTEAGWGEIAQALREPGVSVLESNHRYRGYLMVANHAAFSRLTRPEQLRFLADVESAVASHNAQVRAAQSQLRESVVRAGVRLAPMRPDDYDAVYAQLQDSNWAGTGVARRTMAAAVAVSDVGLANRHFGAAAPAAAPPRAVPYAVAATGDAFPAVGAAPAGGGLLERIFGSIFGGRSSATLSSTAPPAIYYNADLAPQLQRDPAAPNRPVLLAGEPTILRLDIGPRRANSALGGVPADTLAKSTEDVPLTVVISCTFCSSWGETKQQTVYRAATRRADEIRFEFVPQRPADGNGYVNKLQLAIVDDRTGRDYDKLVLPVTVAVGGEPVDAEDSWPMVLPQAAAPVQPAWQADVILYATAPNEGTVSIEFEPVSEDMKKRLGSLAVDAGGKRRAFRTGIDDGKLVEAMTNSAYGAMSALSMQGELLKKLSASGMEAAVSKSNRESLYLSDSESANVAGVIAASGKSFYRRLFYSSADVDLRKVIDVLEVAAAEPRPRALRLRIVTDKLSLPWQYLHPVGRETDPARFWGLQFSLSVGRSSDPEHGPAAPAQGARKIVFAKYGSSNDETVPLAEQQAALLMQMPLTENELLQVDSGPDLLHRVRTERKQIAGIVTFLHASSTDTLPQLQFNEGDVVTSDSLSGLLDQVERSEQDNRYLAAAPLVILNACETGPARNLPYVKLQKSLFELGARGVVVTEVSVWISLGDEVAKRLLARVIKGEAVSDALTDVRRELVRERKNPLGLLYVYYGDPAATLRR